MKIEEGKFYKTRDGRKVGPMKRNAGKTYPFVGELHGGVMQALSWAEDGCFDVDEPGRVLDLIAEWEGEPTFDPLDPPAFGELTDAQKGELLLHAHNGGEIEMMNCGKWAFVHPAFAAGERYRKKPQHVRETVIMVGCVEYGFLCEPMNDDTHRITFDTIDGKPVCDSIKMEEL